MPLSTGLRAWCSPCLELVTGIFGIFFRLVISRDLLSRIFVINIYSIKIIYILETSNYVNYPHLKAGACPVRDVGN